MNNLKRILDPIDSKTLGIFRILFGLLFLIHLLYFSKSANFAHYFIDTKFHFRFSAFDFVEPMDASYMMVIHYVSIAFAFLFLIGLFYRYAAIGLFLICTYLELIDVAYHNNHNYVIILFLLFFSLTGGNRSYSMDKKLFKLSSEIPKWNEGIFRFQIFIIYFFGGIAKLNEDWLDGSVMSQLLSFSFPDSSAEDLKGYVLFTSYAGLLYDLLIVPLLFWKRTRWFALILVLTFNISNFFLFHIGIFPFLMISATLLFFSDKLNSNPESTLRNTPTPKLVLVLLGTYVFIQLALPLRHYFIPGNVHWTGEGYFMSWQMKTFTKVSQIEFMMKGNRTGERYVVPLEQHLLPEQRLRLSYFPKLARQFAVYLENDARSKGIEDVAVYVLYGTSLNGKPMEIVIDQDVDLTEVKENKFGHSTWINLLEH